MFKKVIIALALFIAIPFVASAQKFGTVDVQSIFQAMPERAAAENQLQEASKKYEEEFKKLQGEFDNKFKEYQDLGTEAPQSIKERRETELQDLNNQITKFRQTASQDLEKQQQQLMAPIEQKITDAIKAVGQEGSYTYILQDGMALYQGKDVVDVTAAVKAKLGIK
jgi:outer membrane protein